VSDATWRVPRGTFAAGLVGTDYAERVNEDVQLFGVFLDLNIANAKGLAECSTKVEAGRSDSVRVVGDSYTGRKRCSGQRATD